MCFVVGIIYCSIIGVGMGGGGGGGASCVFEIIKKLCAAVSQ